MSKTLPPGEREKAEGYKKVILPKKTRICLKCRKEFESVIDRLCTRCNWDNIKFPKTAQQAIVSRSSRKGKDI